jgi:hypothetical protein
MLAVLTAVRLSETRTHPTAPHELHIAGRRVLSLLNPTLPGTIPDLLLLLLPSRSARLRVYNVPFRVTSNAGSMGLPDASPGAFAPTDCRRACRWGDAKSPLSAEKTKRRHHCGGGEEERHEARMGAISPLGETNGRERWREAPRQANGSRLASRAGKGFAHW